MPPAPCPPVLSGLDHLLSEAGQPLLEALRGKRVGLLVNPTSITAGHVHAIDVLLGAGVKLVRLFGPEHGVRAEAQDMESVVQSVDALSGLPVVSLYGETFESLEPNQGWVRDLEVVVADIQDVGARYYTYAYTVGLMMKACGQAGIPCWVLDRPNPLGGEVVEGNVVEPGCASFVGMQPLAMRHGMTLGELAGFFARYGGWSCELKVVKMVGWRRSMWYDQTGLPWVMPSPNMPTLDTATVYPGQCLLEGTNLSEGRGTTRPFELFGAPYLDAPALKRALEDCELEGVKFRDTSFKPMFQKHAHLICHGVQAHVTDRQAFRSVAMSVAVLTACRKLAPQEFGWRAQAYEFVKEIPAIDLLFGTPTVRQMIDQGADHGDVMQVLEQGRGSFEQRRQEVLLYG